MPLLYVLQVETEGLVARVAMNGIDVFTDWEGASRRAQTNVNSYVVEGANGLEVMLTPMTDDEGVAIDSPRGFSVTLMRGEHGTIPGPEGRVATYTWREAEAPVEPGVLTGVWGRQFTVAPEAAFGQWAWQRSPAIAPTAEDAAALIALAGEVHDALSARDLATLRALTSLRDEEMARALDMPTEEFAAEQEGYFAEWFGAPGWAMEPFDPAMLAASPYARGRLVRVTDAYGGPCLHGGDGERAFAFAFAATRVDGAWRIAR